MIVFNQEIGKKDCTDKDYLFQGEIMPLRSHFACSYRMEAQAKKNTNIVGGSEADWKNQNLIWIFTGKNFR